MPYWISETLAGVPAFLWTFVGLGLPWSLALLPRSDWRRFVQVATVALVVGPALLTVWMFILGTIGASQESPLLRFDLVFGGTIALALIGAFIVWYRARTPQSPHLHNLELEDKFAFDELLLTVLIGAALIMRWLVIAYWPFTAYDALWVYGYEGRLYTLLGYIPNTIGYYPQYLPLQYTFAQLAYGGINDHVARAGLPFLHLGTILAVYVLGARLFNRRVGIFAAAVWTLYPHVGDWSRAGDLEILLTMLFTLAAAFFLLAWTGQEPRRHYALLAGLMLGVGLWTKPTMGAFVWGMALLVVIELLRVRFNLRAAWARLQLALLALIAAVPLGGIWYIRNILLGHDPLVLPTAYWQSIAARSGSEFGWLLLALLVYLAYVFFGPLRPRPNWRLTSAGLALVLLGLLPSIIDPHRMGLLEWLALAAGAALLFLALYRHARQVWDVEARAAATKLSYALALALPYFITWFYSYSYHYRLSFAIVPLMILPTAVIFARWISPARVGAWHGVAKFAYAAVLVLIALPGVVAGVYDPFAGSDYLWTDSLPNDAERYRSGNPALMIVVDGLQAYLDEHPGERLSVVAPGVDRLPFFFPTQDIRVDDAPTELAQLDGVNYFVYGMPETRGAYDNVPLLQNQVVSALGRGDIMRRAWGMDDGFFRYDVYELNLQNRFADPDINGAAPDDVVIGDFARYLGYDIGGLELWPGRRVVMHLYWEVLAPPPQDYSILIHLRDAEGNLIANWDGPVARTENGWYSTLVWDVGETISDERQIMLPDGVAPEGEGYRLVIGMYDPATNERVPIMVNGEVTDSYVIDDRIAILSEPPQ
jgi:hypothetical protein